MRKILPPAQTQPSVNASVNASPSAISQAGGPGAIAMRIIINIGVAGGNRDIHLANGLCGDSAIGSQTKNGIMIMIITGIIKFCASLLSLLTIDSPTDADRSVGWDFPLMHGRIFVSTQIFVEPWEQVCKLGCCRR